MLMSTMLSSNIRNNLSYLQGSNDIVSKLQEHLSTGRKVNSYADDVSAYIQEQSLLSEAKKNDSLLKDMDRGKKTVDAADSALTGISNLVEIGLSHVTAARDTNNRWDRDNQRGQLADIFSGIQNFAKNAGYRGVNLLAGSTEKFTMNFKVSTFTVQGGQDLTSLDTLGSITQTTIGTAIAATTSDITSTGTGLTNTTNLVTGAGYSVGDTIQLKQNLGDGTNNIDSYSYTYTVTADSQVKDVIDGVNGSGEFKAALNANGTITYSSAAKTDAGATGAVGENNFSIIESSTTATSFLAGTGTTFGSAAGNDSYFSFDSNLDAVESFLNEIGSIVSSQQTSFANSKAIITENESFTQKLTTLLTENANNLVAANIEETAVKMTAAQTQQQMSMTSLSISNQLQQNILALFR